MALTAQGRQVDRAWTAVWQSWLTARLLVGAAWLLAAPLSKALHQQRSRYANGLLGWDAGWYDGIARHGYDGMAHQAYRFFPLVPTLARVLGWAHTGTALLVLSNLAAGVLLWLVYRLALEVGLDEREARRAIWAAALLPAGFVLVMGYSEAVFGCLTAAFLLALSRRSSGRLIAAGTLAGLTRPTAALLVVPALVVGGRALRHDRAQGLRTLLAGASPLLGTGLWLLWLHVTKGDGLLPFRLQGDPHLRGGTVVDTSSQISNALHALPHVTGVTVHLLWAVVAVVLLLAARGRLPIEHQALVLATLAAALTANRLGSLERYVGSALPLLLAAAVVTPRWPARLLAWSSGLTLVLYAALAMGGSATP